MKTLLFSVLFAALCLSTIPAFSQAAFRVDSYSFEEGGTRATIGVGLSCSYNRAGEADSIFVYCCSYSSRQAVIKINGKLVTLKQTGGKDSDVFSNSRYSVSLAVRTDNKDSLQHGRIVVRDWKTKKTVTVKVIGVCDI